MIGSEWEKKDGPKGTVIRIVGEADPQEGGWTYRYIKVAGWSSHNNEERPTISDPVLRQRYTRVSPKRGRDPMSGPGSVREGDEYPPVSESSYTTRPIRFTDTGERADIAVIDGEPVALAPSGAAVDHWLREHRLRAVSEEYVRDHARRDYRDRCWRSFRDRRLLGRLLTALLPGREKG